MPNFHCRCGAIGVGEMVQTVEKLAPRIQFPLNGSRIDVAGGDVHPFSSMPVKVAGGVPSDEVLVRLSVGEIDGPRQRLIDPPGPALHD